MSTSGVAIIGAGLGGLALAQGLKSRGISVTVYEADPAPDSRIQGYRIRIDAQGQRALAEVLPPALYQLFWQTASVASTEGRFLDRAGYEVNGRQPEGWHQAGQNADLEPDLSIHRQTLREILLCGLEGTLRYGHAFEDYHQASEGRVGLRFAHTADASCQLLVGADGVNSRVRAQLAPDAVPADSGYLCLYGKSALTAEKALYEGTNVLFCEGFSAIIDEMRFRQDFTALAAKAGFNGSLTQTEDYLYWALIGPGSRLAVPLDSLSLPPMLQKLIQRTLPEHIATLPVRYGNPNIVWQPGNVTLLGDAVHAMSPAGGIGANTALRDAADLATALHGKGLSGLAEYERLMLARGKAAVADSAVAAAKLSC
ncbi:FAD-dependent monooxygenase [Enterobacter sp. Ap-1006]|uniref:FAD-dependent oxidoreductase n=1 Tax=Enterobacter sp. Ap-1006 TaxID=2608345 RepID=UPI0014233312|nr:FAD-dependent monooxygenase [Enterobacter sp. Ap-1006]